MFRKSSTKQTSSRWECINKCVNFKYFKIAVLNMALHWFDTSIYLESQMHILRINLLLFPSAFV